MKIKKEKRMSKKCKKVYGGDGFPVELPSFFYYGDIISEIILVTIFLVIVGISIFCAFIN